MSTLLYAVVDGSNQYLSSVEPTFITGGGPGLSLNNIWTGLNVFNTSLPTSILKPTLSTQFVTKAYGDATYAQIYGTQTVINGSVSGTVTFSQPFQTASYKKVVLYFNGLLGTASYKFPMAFSKTPIVMTSNGLGVSLVTSLNTSAITVTGATTTGFLMIEGY